MLPMFLCHAEHCRDVIDWRDGQLLADLPYSVIFWKLLLTNFFIKICYCIEIRTASYVL